MANALRSERTSFDIAQKQPMQLIETTGPSWNWISALLDSHRASKFLAAYLQVKRALRKQRIETFVTRRAPRYRPAYIDEVPTRTVLLSAEISDKDLDLLLHRHLAQLEGELLDEGHKSMTLQQHEELSGYSSRLEEYLTKVEDIKRCDLASLHRSPKRNH